MISYLLVFFFSSRRRHTRCSRDWSSDVCSSDLDALRDSAAARVTRVVASGADAGALERARRAGVPTTVLAHPDDPDEEVTGTGGARLARLAGYLKRAPPPAVARLP